MKKSTLSTARVGIVAASLAAVAATSARATKAVAEKVKSASKKATAVVTGDTAAITWPRNHRHVNPYYRERKGGLLYFIVGRGNKHVQRVTAQDVGRWMPHNGAREMARRVRQMERANGAA